MVLYICVSSWLLANKSHDLSQVEKNNCLSKAEQMKTIFTQIGLFFSNLTILSEQVRFVRVVTTIIFVSACDKSRDS